MNEMNEMKVRVI